MIQRIFVTGMGAVTPLGLDSSSTWDNLCRGVSGIDHITSFDTNGFDVQVAAEVKEFEPTNYLGRKESRRMDRFAQFATVAAKEALISADVKLDSTDLSRIGIVIGTGIGGILTLSREFDILQKKGPNRVSPFLIPMMLPDMASAQVSMMVGALGHNYCAVSSCSSSADAIGLGSEMIRRGEVDIVLAGGSEASICPVAIAGFGSSRALSRHNQPPQKASRPFDAHRDGFVMGEGSVVLVLESHDNMLQREVRPLAELKGYAATSDAYHLTEPSPTGKSATEAMKTALQRANVSPSELDYINAHGTSTRMNDRQETQVIKNALGKDAYNIPVSSTKSMTGHLLGAGGALEAMVCISAINYGIIPPTINLEHPDPECDLDYVPTRARKADVKIAMTNSFGFGGHNSALIFSRCENL